MPETRQSEQAPTRTQRLAAGARIAPHRHREHQVVYASRGVLSVETDGGTWVVPATRAVWIPAGTLHGHRAHGHAELHLLGLGAGENPLALDRPTVLEVGPLLRELLLSATRAQAAATPESERLRAVLLDQLRSSPQQPLHLPDCTEPRVSAVCDLLRADPSDPRSLAALGRAVGAGERTLSRLFG